MLDGPQLSGDEASAGLESPSPSSPSYTQAISDACRVLSWVGSLPEAVKHDSPSDATRRGRIMPALDLAGPPASHNITTATPKKHSLGSTGVLIFLEVRSFASSLASASLLGDFRHKLLSQPDSNPPKIAYFL